MSNKRFVTRLFLLIFLTINIITVTINTKANNESTNNLTINEIDFDKTISEPSGTSIEAIGKYDEAIGAPYSLFIEDEFVYITSPNIGIIKLDISEPTNPSLIGTQEIIPFYGDDFIVKDGIAYISNVFSLQILNVADIENVIEVDTITDFTLCSRVKIFDDLLIANDYSGYLRFYNLTDPSNLMLINTINLTHLDFNPTDFDFSNNSLYILGNQDGNSTLLTYNLTSFENPIYLGNYTSSHESWSEKILVKNSTAYVITESEFQVFNASNLTSPQLIYSETLANEYYSLQDLLLNGDRAYVLNYTDIITYDISNSSEISIIDKKTTNAYLKHFAINGDCLFVINPQYSTLSIYDINSTSFPQKISTYYFGGPCVDVCVENNIAYLACCENGTRILDISNPERPNLLGSYSDGDSISKVKISGTLLYALSYDVCLKIIDVSDLENPVLVSEYRSEEPNAKYTCMDFLGNKIVLGQGYPGLEIIDVSDPSNPDLISSNNLYRIWDLEIKDEDYIIAVTYGTTEDFLVYDISNPYDIQIRTILPLEENSILEMTIEENLVYLLCNSYEDEDNIVIIDISNPLRPRIRSKTKIQLGILTDIEVDGDYIYLSDLSCSLVVCKNNFGRISYIGSSNSTYSTGLSLTIDDGYVFTANNWNGLSIYKAFSSLKLSTLVIISMISLASIIVVSVTIRLVLKRRK